MTLRGKSIVGLVLWGVLIAWWLVTLPGCAASPDFGQMTAEQIKAAAADKSAGATCSVLETLTTRGRVVHAMLDRGVGYDAEIVVGQDCSVTIRTLGRR